MKKIQTKKTTKVRLLVLTSAYQTSGGMAVVARLIIRTILENQTESDHLIVCCFAEFEPIHPKLNFKYKGDFTYKVFNKYKFKFAAYIFKTIFSYKPEFIFFDYINLASIVGILGYLKIIKYYTWVHGMEAYPPKPGIRGYLGIKGSHYNFTGTEFTKIKVENNIKGINLNICSLTLEPELSYIPNNLCLQNIAFTSVRGTQDSLGNKVILSVGRMMASEQGKGHDTLLLAFSEIKRKIPEAQLVLAGTGDDIYRLQKLALSLPEMCQNSIFFPGFVTEELKQNLYAHCYCFAMPSRQEGFGLVYLEAMRWGKACLGSTVDAACSVIQDGKTGVLVNNPSSPEEVAEKIISLLKNPDVSLTYGKDGQTLIKNKYFYEHFSKCFWDTINYPCS